MSQKMSCTKVLRLYGLIWEKTEQFSKGTGEISKSWAGTEKKLNTARGSILKPQHPIQGHFIHPLEQNHSGVRKSSNAAHHRRETEQEDQKGKQIKSWGEKGYSIQNHGAVLKPVWHIHTQDTHSHPPPPASPIFDIIISSSSSNGPIPYENCLHPSVSTFTCPSCLGSLDSLYSLLY